MTLVSEIINDAYRESNLIAINEQVSTQEQVDALRLFNRLLRSVFGNEAGDPYSTISIGGNNVVSLPSYYVYKPDANWYVPPNTRLVFNNILPQTINLNPRPNPGERIAIDDASGNFATNPVTLKGNGRTINGATQEVLSTNGTHKEYFYRDDLSDWRLISNLTVADEFPFPSEFENMFVLGLGLRLNPRQSAQMDPQSLQEFRRSRNQFRARYRQAVEKPTEAGLYRLTHYDHERYNQDWPRDYGEF